MLPAPNRLRRSADFSGVVRSGRRSRRGVVVVHQGDGRAGDGGVARAESALGAAPLVGLIVSRAVGNSVVRHRVSRRLRAQLASRLGQLPASSRTVVRALPESARASSAQLGADLDRALRSLAAPR